MKIGKFYMIWITRGAGGVWDGQNQANVINGEEDINEGQPHGAVVLNCLINPVSEMGLAEKREIDSDPTKEGEEALDRWSVAWSISTEEEVKELFAH